MERAARLGGFGRVRPRQRFPRLRPSLRSGPPQRHSRARVSALSLPDARYPPHRRLPGLGVHPLATGTSSAAGSRLTEKGQIHPNPCPAAAAELRVGSRMCLTGAVIPKGFCFLSKGCYRCHANPPGRKVTRGPLPSCTRRSRSVQFTYSTTRLPY